MIRRIQFKTTLMAMFASIVFVSLVACGAGEVQTVEVVKEVVKEVPVEVVKEVEKEVIKEVEKEVIKEVEKIVEVAPEKDKRELIFAALSWDSAMVQNGVARYIVEHGYGYPTGQIEGDTVPLFQGLRKGDIDITMEIWLPNQNAVWDEAIKNGEVIPVGRSLEDNWQNSFLIPGYLQDAYPELDSVEDLKNDEYKELFVQADSGGKAVLVGCLSGWACLGTQQGVTDADGNVVGVGQIEAYGLSDHVHLQIPAAFAALNAAIEGAYAKEEPILHYYWGPTKLASELDMRGLEQPDVSTCKDTDPVHGCAWGPSQIMIAMNTELVADAPELIPFFQNWDWSAKNQLAAEGWYADNSKALEKDGKSTEEIYTATAVWYLSNNDSWKEWMPADVAANVEAALAGDHSHHK